MDQSLPIPLSLCLPLSLSVSNLPTFPLVSLAVSSVLMASFISPMIVVEVLSLSDSLCNQYFHKIPTILRKVKKGNAPTYLKKLYNEGGKPHKI